MNVLIAHQNERSRGDLAHALAGLGVEPVEAADGPLALEILMSPDAPRLALVQWDLPGLEGPELCRLLRDFNLGHPPYIILLTPAGAQHDVTVGLHAGANDFVFLPASGDELRARVEFGQCLVGLPWGQSFMQDPPCERRGLDVVTGVDGRQAILRRLEEELARARREHGTLSVGLLHVDGLDEIDEQGGRQAGAAVLREVARRLRGTLRPYDGVGWLEEGDFLVTMPKTDDLDIGGALERLRAVLTGEAVSFGGRRHHVTVSIGGATWARDEEAGALLADARVALDEARATGLREVVAGRKVELRAVLISQM
jgi:diguanylate cyclase (GGDEF)-like protein